MADTLLTPLEKPRRIHLEWMLPVLFRPRRAFAKIAAQSGSVWLTPLLILSLFALLQVIVAGPIKQQAAQSGQVELPPGFEYYTPEDQAQFQQALAATQSPVFFYVFPALIGIGKVWVGWLIVSGLIHLALTLLGGRGATGSVMNLVAWSGLPFAIRDFVRGIAMLITHQLVDNPGLSGFAPAGEDGLAIFLAAFLGLIDVYVIWHIILLITGVRIASNLTLGKASSAIVFVITLVLLIQALLSYLTSRLSGLTVYRPFF